MEKLEIINLYGKDVVVNVRIAKARTYKVSIAYGHLYVTRTERYSLNEIRDFLLRLLNEKKVEKLHSELFLTDSYIDILGQRKRLVNLSKGQVRTSSDDFVVINDKDLEKKLKSLTKDIVTSRVRHFEQVMNIPEHTVKITNMRAALGKNYYLKRLITIDKNVIHFSLEEIDALLIHELAHYYQHNHSKDFYNIILTYCPNYRKIIKKLIYGERV
jgi:predicted metal-dependent hydrolase